MSAVSGAVAHPANEYFDFRKAPPHPLAPRSEFRQPVRRKVVINHMMGNGMIELILSLMVEVKKI
jgi:hypothetical protein